MEKIKELIPPLTLFFVIVCLGLILSGLSEVRQEINNLSLNLQIQEKPLEDVGNEISDDETTDETVPSDTTRIPTAIIFSTKSSPLLSPQSDLTITIKDVTKSKDGTVTANLKVFTEKASAYSRFDAVNTFELVNMTGSNQSPLESGKTLDSVPPKSAAEGGVVFKVGPEQNEIILQIKTLDDIIFYKFKFNERTYEEVVLG